MGQGFDSLANLRQQSMPSIKTEVCNCIGPQDGELLCPCAMRGKRAQEAAMLLHGVTINGTRYKLVPEGDGGSAI